jgi:hypothetical protein
METRGAGLWSVMVTVCRTVSPALSVAVTVITCLPGESSRPRLGNVPVPSGPLMLLNQATVGAPSSRSLASACR